MKQIGSNDCGLFCIAYAEDLAEGNDPPDIKFDQSCMWRHLVECVKKQWFYAHEIQGISTAEKIHIQKL